MSLDTLLQVHMPEDCEADCKVSEEALERARAAAESHASLAAQRSSSGTGEMLRSNFVVVADLVEEQDGHLLTSKEKARTADFKVGPPAPVNDTIAKAGILIWK